MLTPSQTQTQLLRTHRLLLTLYPPSTLPAEHATRLLKDCLSKLSIVVDIQKAPTASGSSAGDANGSSNGQGGSKKGKKRARGGEEDGLVGAFEGRGGKKIGDEWVVVDEALKCEYCPFFVLGAIIIRPFWTDRYGVSLGMYRMCDVE